MLRIDDLVGGLWIPGDGVGDPYETCLSLVAEAKEKGHLIIASFLFTIHFLA